MHEDVGPTVLVKRENEAKSERTGGDPGESTRFGFGGEQWRKASVTGSSSCESDSECDCGGGGAFLQRERK